MPKSDTPIAAGLALHEIKARGDFSGWLAFDALVAFLHENMKPYEDTPRDIARALEYALSTAEGKGGFILVAARDEEIVGAIVILHTGMAGYIPENILVFVGVKPTERGQGIGRFLIDEALARCEGEMKLHVEYDNPAKRLYERIGFTSKYAEMRISREEER